VAGVSGSPADTREAGEAGPSEPEPATIPAPAVGTDPAPAAGSELVAGDGQETATGSEERGTREIATGGPAATGAGVGAEGGATEPQSADAPPATLAEFMKLAARQMMVASTGYGERTLFDATVKDIRDNRS
jgi:hypothetical protein